MSRVLSTDTAKQSITQMQTIINNGLTEQIKNLNTQGDTLSDPNVWDGTLAATFRGSWPETSAALDKVVADLEVLRSKIQTINTNIMTAGGNA